MTLIKIFEQTKLAPIEHLQEKRKAAAIAYLKGPGNRRKSSSSGYIATGRRSTDSPSLAVVQNQANASGNELGHIGVGRRSTDIALPVSTQYQRSRQYDQQA